MQALTTNFTLEEFIASDYAKKNKIDNTPNEGTVKNLLVVATNLQSIRTLLGNKPIIITSGYRNKEVNVGVGGSKTSAHIDGFAVDFICPKFGSPLEICKKIDKSSLKYDQLIMENTWVHVSFDPKLRRENLTKISNGYKKGF